MMTMTTPCIIGAVGLILFAVVVFGLAVVIGEFEQF